MKEFLEKELAFRMLPDQYKKTDNFISIKLSNLDARYKINDFTGRFNEHLERLLGKDIKIGIKDVRTNSGLGMKELTFHIISKNIEEKELQIAKLIEDFKKADKDNNPEDIFGGRYRIYSRLKIDMEKTVNQHVVTFFNKYQKEQNFIFEQRGSVVDLTKCNPPIKIPAVIPKYTKKQFMDTARAVFEGLPTAKDREKIETYLGYLEFTINRCFAEVTPWRNETTKGTETYLMLILDQFLTNNNISEERKRETLINIAEECKGNETCDGGEHGKVQNAYEKLTSSEGNLLTKVELYKTDLLTHILKDQGQSVHKAAYFKHTFGAEYGLNTEGTDKTHHQGWETSENHKRAFEKSCRENLVKGVYDLVIADKRDGSIVGTANYQENLKKILQNEGLKPQEIEEEIDRLIPRLGLKF